VENMDLVWGMGPAAKYTMDQRGKEAVRKIYENYIRCAKV
jgi:hypothetical protein